VGNRNRRAEPTTNKLKRRLSLTLTGRPLVSPRSESAKHVGLFRLSSAEVQGQRVPHCHLSAPARQSDIQSTAKNTKKKPTPIDDGLHATPSNGCDQDHQITGRLYSWNHLYTSLVLPSLPINFLFSLFRPFASSFTHLPLVRILTPICCPQGQSLSFPSDQRSLDALFMHFYTFYQSLRLWVYHRDFGATPSVIYGK
jgi:hypothetical protein